MVAEIKAGEILFHDKSADASGADVRRGDGKHHIGIRLGGVGNKDLSPVQDIVVALEDGGGLRTAGIGACVGLRESERADLLPPGQRRQVFPLLLIRTVGEDGP